MATTERSSVVDLSSMDDDAKIRAYLEGLTDEELRAHMHGATSVSAAPPSAPQGPAGVAVTAPAPQESVEAPAPGGDVTEGMSAPELFAAGAGQRVTEMGRPFQQIYYQFRPPEERQAFNARLDEARRLDRRLMQNAAAQFGAGAVDLLPAARVTSPLKAAALFGTVEALRPTDEWTQPFTRFGKGALGSMVGYGAQAGLSKGLNALRGGWAPIDQGLQATDRWAREHGVNLAASDLAPDSFLRGWEDFSNRIPILSLGRPAKTKQQATKLSELINSSTPRGDYVNAMANSVRGAAKDLSEESRIAWERVYDMARVNKTTNVVPKDLVANLQAYLNTYGAKTMTSVIPDIPLRNRIIQLAMVKDPKKATMTFEEMRDIQKALFATKQFGEGLRMTSAIPKEQAEALSSLYSATHADLERWGMHGSNAKTYEAYLDALDQYKRTVLPFQDTITNPVGAKFVAGRHGAGAYENRPSTMIKDILSPANTEDVAELARIAAPVSEDAAQGLRTVQLADRAARLVAGQDPVRPSTVGLAGSAYMGAMYPHVMAGALAAEEAANSLMQSRLFKELYMADPALFHFGPLRRAGMSAQTVPGVAAGLGAQWLTNPYAGAPRSR